MPGADRTVTTELIAKVSGYTGGMRQVETTTRGAAVAMREAAAAEKQLVAAQRATTSASRQAVVSANAQAAAERKRAQAVQATGRGLLAVGVVAAAGFGLAARSSIQFGREMGTVATLAHASASEVAALSAAALTVGQRFGFTAHQVSEAEQELVKAGLSVRDVLGGALTGTLTLAAAGQTDLATATEITASAMTQFGKSGKDVPHIADLLAAGADKALGSVTDLGFGLQQVGPQAATAGISLENTIGTLAAFAQQGQIGERAGTELKQMLLQLQGPSKQASDEMQRYGLQLYKANGQTKDFTQIAGALQKSFQGVSDKQRAAAFSIIFGSRAVLAANILYRDGATGPGSIGAWTDSVNDAGFAALQAGGKLNNLGGDLTKLKAAFTTGLIETGQSSSGVLRALVQDATGVVLAYNQLSSSEKAVVDGIAGVTGGVALLSGGLVLALPKLVAFSSALKEITATSKLSSALGAIGSKIANPYVAALTLGAAALGVFVKGHVDAAARVADLTSAITADSGALGENTRQVTVNSLAKQGALRDASQLGISLKLVTDAAVGQAGAVTQLNAALEARRAAVVRQRQDDSISVSDAQDQIDTISELKRTVLGQAAAYKTAQAAVAQQAEAMGKTASSTANAASASDTLVASLQQIGGQLKTVTFDVTTFDNALTNLGHAFDVKGLQDQLTKGFHDLAAQAKKSGTAVKGNSDAAIANRNALRQQYQTALQIVQAYADQKNAAGENVHSAGQVEAKARAVAAQFQNQAGKAGFAAGKVKDYTKKLNAVPGEVATHVDADTRKATAAVAAFKRFLATLHTVTVTVNYKKNRQSLTDSQTGGNGYRGGTAQAGYGIRGMDSGGTVGGGRPGRDTVGPVFLDNDEEVIRASQARKHRPLLKAINSGAMGFAAGGTIGMAAGGSVGANIGDIFSLFSSTPSHHDALQTYKSASASLSSAEDHLAKLRKSGTASAKALAAAEGRVDVARAKRRSAHADLATSSKSAYARFSADSTKVVKADGAFMANLQKLAARGFGTLAATLLAQGDDDAKRIAAQAVHMSNASLTSLNTRLGKSAAQQTKLGLLPAELAISSALKTGKNPTLASIAAATGIDQSDLQAGLLDMRKSLAGNKNAAALLRGLNSTGTYVQGTWGSTTGQLGAQFNIQVQAPPSGNPYAAGVKAAQGVQRVIAVSGGRW